MGKVPFGKVDSSSSCIYILQMITWHETKRRTNLKKHGIDLAELESAFDSPMITLEDDSEDASSSWSGPSAMKALI